MATSHSARPAGRDIGGAAVFLACVAIVAVVGSVAASSSGRQYAALNTPLWAPPSWLFGPVWTVLYVMIDVSGWLVWRRAGSTRAVAVPLGIYAVQLVLNLVWTPLFFAAGRYGIAFAEIILLVAAVGCTIVVFAGFTGRLRGCSCRTRPGQCSPRCSTAPSGCSARNPESPVRGPLLPGRID